MSLIALLHGPRLSMFECDLNYDKIVSSDYNDLMTAYKCFLGIKNCDTIQFRDWENMKKEYECFTGDGN